MKGPPPGGPSFLRCAEPVRFGCAGSSRLGTRDFGLEQRKRGVHHAASRLPSRLASTLWIGDDIDLRLRSWNPKCVLTIGRLLLEIPQRGRYNSALRALRRPPPQAHSGRAVAQGFDPGIQTTLGPPFDGPFSVVRAGRFARLTPPCDARLPRGTAESPSPRLRRHWAAPASARDRLSHSDRGRGQSEASRASSSRRWSNSRPRH